MTIMKQASCASLHTPSLVLAAALCSPSLKERNAGTFYLRGKAFLHSHEDTAGLIADCRFEGTEFKQIAVFINDAQRQVKGRLALFIRGQDTS